MRYIKILALSLFMLCSMGCTKEDLSVCVTRTAFKCVFDLNNEHTDQFYKLVNKVDLYIFNGSGILVKHIAQSQNNLPQGYTFEIDLNYGNYTAVMYGTQNGYNGVSVGAKQKNLTTALAAMKEGQSSISDLRLMLNSINGFSDKDLGVVLHGMVPSFEVSSIPRKTPHKVAFTRNTKVVELNISGLENIIDEPTKATRALNDIAVRIDGENKAYLYDNALDMELGKVSHAPYSLSFANKILTCKTSVLRLFAEHPMTLKVFQGSDEIWKLNLTAEIMKSPKYANNADLDREDTFVIDVKITSEGGFTITVNGWNTTSSDNVIG